MSIWIKLTPNDTLFFRGGRPFTMGSETWSDKVFPPYPSTVYGAIRAFLMLSRVDSPEDLEQLKWEDIGSIKEKGKMQIVGPFLYNEKTKILYLPPPLDLVRQKKNENEVSYLKLSGRPEILYTDVESKKLEKIDVESKKLEKILVSDIDNQVESIPYYVDHLVILDYLSNKKRIFRMNKTSIFKEELKIGIKRNPVTLTSEEEHLYRIPLIRLNPNLSILVKVDQVEGFPEKGVFKLGGEGKTVKCEKLNEIQIENEFNGIQINLNDEKIFKIYLATPAIFKKGWIPEWIDEESLEGEKDGIRLKLVSCAIGKYIRIGGWDMKENGPKPMYKAVPAGSVYYFKVLDDGIEAEKMKETFHLKNISDINPEEGFGLSFVGGVI